MSSKSPGLLVSLAFLFGGVLAAIGIGVLAATINRTGWAPVGIFSLGVGIVVGVAATALARWLGVACPTRLTVATLVMALVAVVAQHAWLYRDYCQQWRAVRDREPALALFRPETTPMSPGEYFAAEFSPARLAFWAADLALVAAAAIGTVLTLRNTRTHDSCTTPQPLSPDP